ncbi:hypothetical protein HG530_009277 [Fusarium avenaceum]|nr:hypothetical protein HG530_009277 [Fusarium avenaceum]
MATPQGITNDGYEIQFGTTEWDTRYSQGSYLPPSKRLPQPPARPKNVRIINSTSSEEARSPTTEAYDLNKLKTDMVSTSTLIRYGISKSPTSTTPVLSPATTQRSAPSRCTQASSVFSQEWNRC